MMLHKLYVHGGEDFTIVVAVDEKMERVADLCSVYAERWNERHSSDVVDASRLVVRLVEGEGAPLELGRLLSTIKAKSDLFVSIVKPESFADRLKLEGNACLTAGKVHEAIAKYSEAIKAAPKWPLPYLNRSLAYLKLPDSFRLAEQDARKAASLDPSSVKARYRIAQALFGMKKFEACHAELTRAMDMDTVTPAQALDLGQLAQLCEDCGAGRKGVEASVARGASEARLPVAAFVRLKPYFDMAYEAMEKQSWGRAIEVYRSVLDIYPDDFTSLLGLAHCLLNNKSGKYCEAIPLLERLVAGSGTAEFGAWRLLGQARTEEGNFRASETALQRAAALAEEDENAERKKLRQIDVALGMSRALEGADQWDTALQYVTRVLQDESEHSGALLRYGELMLRAGGEWLDEGLKVALRLLVTSGQKDPAVRRLFCQCLRADARMTGVLMEMLDTVAPERMQSSSWAFLASVAKEYSALSAALALLERAVASDPTRGPGHMLSLVHTLEVDGQEERAIDIVRQWLATDQPDWELRGLRAGAVAQAWNDAPRKKIFVMAPDPDGDMGKGLPDWATGPDLDFLALLFVLIKLLYLKGDWRPIASIVELIEPVRSGWQFHLTNIRNEQAYYCCAVQSLEYHDSNSMESAVASMSESNVLHVVGDSHSLPLAWRRLESSGQLMRPYLVTGCKMWHLRPEGEFFPKHNFERQMDAVPNESNVMFVLGEIDCREGLLVCIEKGRYETLEEGATVVIDIFIEVAEAMCNRKRLRNAYMHPIIPVLNPTRHIVQVFNDILKQRIDASKSLKWLDFYDALVELRAEEIQDENGSKFRLKTEFELDGTHLRPTYTKLISDAIAK